MKLLYQGHASFRLSSSGGAVAYIDPFAGDGYEKRADLVLITHEHHDHNATDKLKFSPKTRIIRAAAMTDGKKYSEITASGFSVRAVPAYNANHPREKCVGYVIEADGKKIYAAGDTSTTDEMAALASENLDLALFPTDGFYNMDATEAAKCAAITQAKRSAAIHTSPVGGKVAKFDTAVAEKFAALAPNGFVLTPGEEITI